MLGIRYKRLGGLTYVDDLVAQLLFFNYHVPFFFPFFLFLFLRSDNVYELMPREAQSARLYRVRRLLN